MKRSYLTVSVDDGHPTDRRTADLLGRFGLEATFYIPVRRPGHAMMSDADIRELAREFDIGGHTLNHRSLPGLPHDEARLEVVEGRRRMEDLIGAPTHAFSYPRGKFDADAAHLVRQAGYVGARTCRFNRTELSADPFAWGVSTHANSHPRHVQLRHALVEANWRGIADFVRVHRMKRDWESHFLHGVDWVAARGGVAHLVMHSWEIEANGEWEKLERVLARVSERAELERVSNAELFRRARAADEEAAATP